MEKHKDTKAVVNPADNASDKGAQPVAATRLAFGNQSAGHVETDEVAQLRAEVQLQKVEAGRVKALAAQLKERELELEQLRKDNAKYESQRSAVDFVDPELREIVDQDILRANASMIEGSQKMLRDEVNQRVTPLQQSLELERNKRIQAESLSMDLRIEQKHPGFAAQTQPGGQYADAWSAYLDQVDPRTGLKNGVLLVGAYEGNRDSGVTAMIDSFMNQDGISRGNSMFDSAFPGKQHAYVEQNNAARDQTVYTMKQYKAQLEESGHLFRAGKITAAERQTIIEKLTLAARTGRVMQEPASPVGM